MAQMNEWIRQFAAATNEMDNLSSLGNTHVTVELIGIRKLLKIISPLLYIMLVCIIIMVMVLKRVTRVR